MFRRGFACSIVLGIPIARKGQMPLTNVSQFSAAEDLLPAAEIRWWENIPCYKPYPIWKLDRMGINGRNSL